MGNMLEEGVCRAPCSTFAGMSCLSQEPQFGIDIVEVWGCIAGYVADEKELEAAGVKKKHKKSLDEYMSGKSKTCLDGDVGARVRHCACVCVCVFVCRRSIRRAVMSI